MEKIKLIHAWERVNQTSTSDAEKIRLLVSIITDLRETVSLLEADLKVLHEKVFKG